MENQVVIKSIRLQKDLADFIESEAKRNRLTQNEFMRVAIKSIKIETLDKIREARELVGV